MKLFDYTKARLRGIYDAVVRYWTVFLLLTAAAVLRGISISSQDNFERHITALILGAFCFLLAHALGERFGRSLAGRGSYLLAALIATAAYYVYLLNVESLDGAATLRTTTLIFALSAAFILTPSSGGKADFNAVFLSVFKAFFTSLFFSGIIFGGVYLIFIAIDNLLVRLDGDIYAHIANIIWGIIAPMLMLSLIPVFGGRGRNAAKLEKATGYPKFLDILLTYVLIPLASLYTLVLVIYMGKTIALRDWQDNLLEPMLLTYLIAVLVIYLLVKRLKNAPARFFVRLFPAFISVIAAFQLVASVIKASDEGVVAARYNVLLFSVYSIIVGALLFLRPAKPNGYVGALAVAFALIAAAPVIGAYDVSIRNHIEMVENVLFENQMLSGGALTPKSNISDQDKQRLTRTISYLDRAGELDRLEFLPDGFSAYSDFERVFGFDPYGEAHFSKDSKHYLISDKTVISTAGYDYFISYYLYLPQRGNTTLAEIGGGEYTLRLSEKNGGASITLSGKDGLLLEAPLGGIYDKISEYSYDKEYLDVDRLTFDFENDAAKIRIVMKSVSIYSSTEEKNLNADVFILFGVK